MARLVSGYCTPGCGACCRILALPIPGERAVRRARHAVIVPLLSPDDPTWRQFLAARGVRVRGRWAVVPCLDVPEPLRIGTYGGAAAVYVQSICRQLDDQGKCRLHGTPEYPIVCDAWPTPDDDLAAVAEKCTYRIIDQGAAE